MSLTKRLIWIFQIGLVQRTTMANCLDTTVSLCSLTPVDTHTFSVALVNALLDWSKRVVTFRLNKLSVEDFCSEGKAGSVVRVYRSLMDGLLKIKSGTNQICPQKSPVHLRKTSACG